MKVPFAFSTFREVTSAVLNHLVVDIFSSLSFGLKWTLSPTSNDNEENYTSLNVLNANGTFTTN